LCTWPIPAEVLDRIQLDLEDKESLDWEASTEAPTRVQGTWELVTTAPPEIPLGLPRDRAGPRNFTPRLDINFVGKSARARRLGKLGERLVVEAERRRLTACGRGDLAKRIVHIAKERGDGAGYDVLSFSDDGQELFIEVKTTTGGPQTDFLVTVNELEFASKFSNQYRLYRLFHFDEVAMTAEAYVVDGDFRRQLPLSPTEYRVSGLRSAKAR
jgi:hypothetical protein